MVVDTINLQSGTIKKIKDAGSKFSVEVVSKLKSSKLGKAGTKAVTYVKDVGKAAAGTKIGKALAPAIEAAGPAVGPGVDIAMGTVNIASHAQEENVSAGRKAYNITGDVVGTVANVGIGMAASLVAGPLAIAIIAVQMCGAILDAVWDPFKNYFNSDLETMRLNIISSLKTAYAEANMNYPIETKPDILSSLTDPNSAESKEYIQLMKTYLEDRGFITSEEVRAEEEYFLSLKSIKRQRKLYRINENGELEMQDPDLAAIALFDSATNNDLVMMALAAKYAQHKKQTGKPEQDLTSKTNYIIGALVISCLFLIFFFSFIFIASV